MRLKDEQMMQPYYELHINGKKVEDEYKQYITSLEVEHSDSEAALARVNVSDLGFAFTDHIKIKTGMKLKVIMGFLNKTRVLFDGEITHAEADFGEDGVPTLVIGALDKINSMNAVKKDREWKKQKSSDIVSKIFKEHGITPVVQTTSEVHDQITQSNESDAELIARLADDEGYQFFIVSETNKGYFGYRFKDVKVKDTLFYAAEDFTIRSFKPSVVESYNTSTSTTKNVSTKTGQESSSTSTGTTEKPKTTTLVNVNGVDASVTVKTVPARNGK